MSRLINSAALHPLLPDFSYHPIHVGRALRCIPTRLLLNSNHIVDVFYNNSLPCGRLPVNRFIRHLAPSPPFSHLFPDNNSRAPHSWHAVQGAEHTIAILLVHLSDNMCPSLRRAIGMTQTRMSPDGYCLRIPSIPSTRVMDDEKKPAHFIWVHWAFFTRSDTAPGSVLAVSSLF